MAWWSPPLQNPEASPSSISLSMDLEAEAHSSAFNYAMVAGVTDEEPAMLPQGHQNTISESARQQKRNGRTSVEPSGSADIQKEPTTRQSPPPKLACPFFMGNPILYDGQCSGRSFGACATVKQHIARDHVTEVPPIRCSSCNHPCTEALLESHESSCEEYQKGVGLHKLARQPSMKLLCSEVKGKTEEEKWTKMFKVLYPGKPVSSPYWTKSTAASAINFFQHDSTASFEPVFVTTAVTYLSRDISTSELHLEPLSQDLLTPSGYAGAQWDITPNWQDKGSNQNHAWEQTGGISEADYEYEAECSAGDHVVHEVNE